jgi:hypothetical protein
MPDELRGDLPGSVFLWCRVTASSRVSMSSIERRVRHAGSSARYTPRTRTEMVYRGQQVLGSRRNQGGCQPYETLGSAVTGAQDQEPNTLSRNGGRGNSAQRSSAVVKTSFIGPAVQSSMVGGEESRMSLCDSVECRSQAGSFSIMDISSPRYGRPGDTPGCTDTDGLHSKEKCSYGERNRVFQASLTNHDRCGSVWNKSEPHLLDSPTEHHEVFLPEVHAERFGYSPFRGRLARRASTPGTTPASDRRDRLRLVQAEQTALSINASQPGMQATDFRRVPSKSHTWASTGHEISDGLELTDSRFPAAETSKDSADVGRYPEPDSPKACSDVDSIPSLSDCSSDDSCCPVPMPEHLEGSRGSVSVRKGTDPGSTKDARETLLYPSGASDAYHDHYQDNVVLLERLQERLKWIRDELVDVFETKTKFHGQLLDSSGSLEKNPFWKLLSEHIRCLRELWHHESTQTAELRALLSARQRNSATERVSVGRQENVVALEQPIPETTIFPESTASARQQMLCSAAVLSKAISKEHHHSPHSVQIPTTSSTDQETHVARNTCPQTAASVGAPPDLSLRCAFQDGLPSVPPNNIAAALQSAVAAPPSQDTLDPTSLEQQQAQRRFTNSDIAMKASQPRKSVQSANDARNARRQCSCCTFSTTRKAEEVTSDSQRGDADLSLERQGTGLSIGRRRLRIVIRALCAIHRLQSRFTISNHGTLSNRAYQECPCRHRCPPLAPRRNRTVETSLENPILDYELHATAKTRPKALYTQPGQRCAQQIPPKLRNSVVRADDFGAPVSKHTDQPSGTDWREPEKSGLTSYQRKSCVCRVALRRIIRRILILTANSAELDNNRCLLTRNASAKRH